MLNHLQGSSPEFEASAKPVESERRRSPRAVLQQLAYIRLEPDSGAIVLNVSEDGLAFHAVAPVHQSGTIRFSFSVKGNGQIQAVGELAWTDESRKTGGIKFTYLPDAAREQIRKWAAQSGLPQKPPTRIDKAAAAPVTAARELPAPPRAEPIARPEPAPAFDTSVFGVISARKSAPSASTDDFQSFGSAYSRSATEELQLPAEEHRPKFLRGFMSGLVVAILAAGGYFFYTHQEQAGNWLRQHGVDVNWTSNPPDRTPGPAQPTGSAPAASGPAPSAPAASASPRADVPTESVRPAVQSPAAQNIPELDASSEAPAPVQDGRSRVDAAERSSRRNGSARSRTFNPSPRASDLETSAAESTDDGESTLRVAQSYLYGSNRPRNSAAAAKLLWAAVQKGNSTAEIILANLYARGDGVTRSCEQARVLLKAAADRGSDEARRQMQQLRSTCSD